MKNRMDVPEPRKREPSNSDTLLQWITRQAQGHGGTVTISGGTLTVTVPTVKAGGNGEYVLKVSLATREPGGIK